MTTSAPAGSTPETISSPPPLPDRFRIGMANYQVDEHGVIHQLPPWNEVRYDVGYVSERYDTIPESVANISYLRAGHALAICGKVKRVLDVGYGNGGFLKAMRAAGCACTGCDISGYPVPEGCEFLPWPAAVAQSWDLATFFDSLEHFPDLGVLQWLRTRWLVITVPWVPEEVTVDWLAAWKHLRPGEHLHHFRVGAFVRWLRTLGYMAVRISHLEDMIRRPATGQPNTVTLIFEKWQRPH